VDFTHIEFKHEQESSCSIVNPITIIDILDLSSDGQWVLDIIEYSDCRLILIKALIIFFLTTAAVNGWRRLHYFMKEKSSFFAVSITDIQYHSDEHWRVQKIFSAECCNVMRSARKDWLSFLVNAKMQDIIGGDKRMLPEWLFDVDMGAQPILLHTILNE